MFCLPKQLADQIKKAIRSGQINPEKLNEMTSAERRDFLTKIIDGESAKQVNLLFEQKLLLKNQERAMYDWASQITGMSKEAKEVILAKIKQTYADKSRRLYDPKENENFLNEITSDIYSKKYKTEVSLEEAQTITELAQDAKVTKEKLLQSGEKGFGAAKVALDNYVNAIRIETIKNRFVSPFKEIGIKAKVEAIIEDFKTSYNFIAENSRAIAASCDDSFWFRQGYRALVDPRYTITWVKDFAKSWVDIYKTIKGKIGGETFKQGILGKDAIKVGDAILDGVKAEGYERPNFLNGRYEAKVGDGPRGTKLDIGTGEEAYPTSFPSKIPIVGRFFKGSEVAYEAGAMRLRMDIADKVYKWAEKGGADMTDNKVIGDLNEVINGMTGRGSFGKRAGGFERATNKAIFSIKFFKSNFDYLTLHQGRLGWSRATALAATNLLYTVVSTALLMKLAQVLNPRDNKDIFNNTSSNFGKIKNGNMTIDLTHGAGGIVVASSKIITQKTTSATTGITTKLGEGYGSQTGMDVIWNFIEGKFAPMFGTIRDIISQKTYQGKKPTILGEAKQLTTPISIQNISQFKSEPMGMRLLGLIADGLGLNVNVYSTQTDWSQSTSKEMIDFKAKVGEDKFKQANNEWNKKVNEYLQSEKYQSLSNEKRQEELPKEKDKIKSNIFKKNNFKPVTEKSTTSTKSNWKKY